MSEATTAPPVTSTCTCEKPLPVQLAERKGASRTHCARCGKPMPLRLLS
jgi:hypothetical protein